MKTLKILTAAAIVSASLTACHNSDNKFPDFDYQTVYFAKQSVARTVVLGNDSEIDLTMDNNHQVAIQAILGGTYENGKKRIINVEVDPTLLDNAYFADDLGGGKAELLPDDYYTLSAGTITINPGSHKGNLVVSLTDKFFNDPKSIGLNYVIPVVMTHAEGVDSILEGKPSVENPDRMNPTDWSVAPKDYILYCVKFVNEWNGSYLRRGEDQITAADGTTTTVTRRQEYVERDEVVYVNTSAYRQCKVELSTKTDADHRYDYTLVLNFNDDGTCTVATDTPGLTASGSGRFVEKGEKNSISGNDCDGLYLDYTVSNGQWTVKTNDTMVMRGRNVFAEYPEIVKK